jgi:AraC-like DNA-binding protein
MPKRTSPSLTASTDYLQAVDASHAAVACKATNYPAGTRIPSHRHNKHQLIHAVRGLMVVTCEQGRWVVPSTRAIFMPAGCRHQVDCVGELHMRSLYIRPDQLAHMPAQPAVVSVGALLRELIVAAMQVAPGYAENSRDGHLLQLLLDELHTLPELPLHLPEPSDPRLRRIARRLRQHPEDPSSLQDWSRALAVDARTVQRLCQRELGMSFGQWRQQARLLHALQRLAAGEKVIDVALVLGYASPSAFSRMFKRQFGQTPSQFFAG